MGNTDIEWLKATLSDAAEELQRAPPKNCSA